MTTPRRTLRYKVLMAATLFVVVAWCVAWFCVATVVDRHTVKAEKMVRRQGALADCANHKVEGFPFRIELRCGSGTRIGTDAATVTMNGLVAAALVYRPTRLLAEVRSPVTIDTAALPELEANWSLAHASTRIDLGERAMSRFDLEIKNGEVAAGTRPLLGFLEMDFNARRHPTQVADLDVALHLTDLVPLGVMEPLELRVQGTLADGAALLSTDPVPTLQQYSADGVAFELEVGQIRSGRLIADASGTLTLSAAGELDGTLDVALAGYDEGLPYLDALPKGAGDTIATLLQNVLAFAPEVTIDGRPAKQLQLTIRNGRVSAGIVPLFRIPRTPLAQSLPL